MKESFFGFLVCLAFAAMVMSLASILRMMSGLPIWIALGIAVFGSLLAWHGILYVMGNSQQRKK